MSLGKGEDNQKSSNRHRVSLFLVYQRLFSFGRPCPVGVGLPLRSGQLDYWDDWGPHRDPNGDRAQVVLRRA
jgi:hypothetical protein